MKANYIDNFQEWEKGFSFFSEVRVRFSETDMYGHMNNTISFTYFEQARIDYFRHLGILMPSVGEEDVKSIPIVADLQCDYVKQVFFDDVLRIYTKIAQVGNSSMDIHYLAKNQKDEICFTGRGTIVQMDPRTGKSVPISEEEKTKLNQLAMLPH
ncbi:MULTISPECIES: thioesterase family protein [Lysinibacillus]|uniref:Acyl-CoA thioester hydrolase n=1 Tax=Lysinibacillus boronitolerans JCM 21713 = 10a = NBRC 103108 TaxID=1294264 RepID=A0ABR4XXF1_9BACI|nr:thioesterase family protein [Lysinibacillus boronitolerans]KGR84045.1 acyl-CoA thioester hydrolase [Lysinibacillus boronitolerans JCM 21713 = 10a = NBRC 103108]